MCVSVREMGVALLAYVGAVHVLYVRVSDVWVKRLIVQDVY